LTVLLLLWLAFKETVTPERTLRPVLRDSLDETRSLEPRSGNDDLSEMVPANEEVAKPLALLRHINQILPDTTDASSVINAIDRYCWSSPDHWMMNIGDVKGEIMDVALRDGLTRFKSKHEQHQPSSFTALELGTYSGYGAIRIARTLRPRDRLWTVEFNPQSAKIASQMIKRAGVSDCVTLLTEDAADVISHLRSKFSVDRLDFVLIDHWKDLYLPHFQLLEASGLLRAGTTIVGDNIIYPGAPAFLAYMMDASDQYRCTLHESKLEYTLDQRDAVLICIKI